MSANKQTLLKAIETSDGSLADVAKIAGCSVRTVFNHLDRDNEVAEAVSLARKADRHEMVDIAEQKLKELVEAGDGRAIKFMLSTQGKARGYGLAEEEGQFRLVRIGNGSDSDTD